MLEYRGVRLCSSIVCVFVVLGSLTGGSWSSDWRLAQALDRVLSSRALEGAFVGAHVVDLKTGRTLYSKNGELLFIPASSQKLLTTAAALHWLGPRHRFETGFYALGTISADSTLVGDLVVRGSGDPSCSSTFGIDPDSLLLTWADSLKTRGIARIQGSVVADESEFDGERLGYGWDWHYLSYWYAPEVSALSCWDNAVLVRVSPGRLEGSPAIVGITPRTSYVNLDENVVTSGPGEEASVRVARRASTNDLSVSGLLPLDSGTRSYRVSVHDPALFFARRLGEVLTEDSVMVGGSSVRDSSAKAGQLLFLYHSPELESIVTLTNRMSLNLSAEMIFKAMGARVFGKGTFENGARAVAAYLSSIGVDTSRIVCVDGSGLSRRNLVSPRAVVQLLQKEWQGPIARSLPVSGSSGTLESRMKGPDLSGRVHAKTGTLDQTSALCGYVLSVRGRSIAFAVLCNHFVCDVDSIRSVEEQFCEALVRYRPGSQRPWEAVRGGKVR